MPRSLILRAGMEAARRVKEREFREVHGLIVGQILFALGWSLFWASALALLTFIPMAVGLGVMVAGLCAPAAERWRRHVRSTATAREVTPIKQPDAARAADRPW